MHTSNLRKRPRAPRPQATRLVLMLALAALTGLPAGVTRAQGTQPAVPATQAVPAQPVSPMVAPPAAAPGMSGEAARPASGELEVRRASRVIGADVLDVEGRKVGDIKDVVFDANRGQVAYAVVGFGGVMGLGTRYYAIPWNVLHQPQPARPGDRFVINMTREQMRNAPSFERNQWPDMASEAWHRDIARFYAQTPYWEGAGQSARGTAPPAAGMGGAGTGGTGNAGRANTGR